MDTLQEFAASSNGDRWLLGNDPASGQLFVLHRGNASSGGHETRTSVDAFLSLNPSGAEREALLAVLNGANGPDKNHEVAEEKTPSVKLAEEYINLGGTRRAKVDDNIVSTRKWEDEPAEAAAFWAENIEPMDDKPRRDVEIHLPSISDD